MGKSNRAIVNDNLANAPSNASADSNIARRVFSGIVGRDSAALTSAQGRQDADTAN